MKFDRRIFSNIILFVVLIAVTVIVTTCQSTTAIKTAFGDDLMGISSRDYSMNIAYSDVDAVELLEGPNLGDLIDGKNRPELKSGIWRNEAWGEYHLCFNPNGTSCIVVHLNNGQTYVFNCNTNEDTAQIYETLLTYIE